MNLKKTTADHEPGGSGLGGRYNGYKLGWLHDGIFFIILVAALFVLLRFVIGISAVGGASMEPVLQNRDVVIYLRGIKDLRPGDIVSMRVPAGEYYVKRVAAVGGDVVDIRGGEVYVNDEKIEDPRVKGKTYKKEGAVIYPYTVRPGNVFVLGDNREVSMDSRAFGEVNLRQIRGKIVLRLGLWYMERPR